MPELVYGVWDSVPFDTRSDGRNGPNVPTDVIRSALESFDSGNAVSLVLSDRGFLVLDTSVPLLWALQKHFQKVASESCGKCSPCRTGAPLIANLLQNALKGGDSFDFDLLREIAEQMRTTSLCGVGKTGPIPLLDAIAHFKEELKPAPADMRHGFFSTMTSPCIEACPGLVNIPRYIDYIKDGHVDLSANLVLRHYPLVGSCGRVCVRSCESACKRAHIDSPISIRNLKRFAADKALASGVLTPLSVKTDKESRVAVVGAGPVGITCAYHLLTRGYPVDIFEAKSKAGGMIRYGIPIYRLPKDTLDEEIAIVTKMGAKIAYNQKLGRDFHVDDLFKQGYSAVFLACGCPKGSYLGMKGEDTSLANYENGIDFLERVYEGVESGKPPVLEGDVVVVGGGNVAMDCCRAAKRVAKGTVHLIYRRTEADAPADREEILAAKAEGVEFHFLCGQDSLLVQDGAITGLRVLAMEQTEPDASGRRGVKPKEGASSVIPCSHVIAAIGQRVDPAMLTESEGIERDRKQCVVVNAAQETSREGVFAAGDCTSGPRASGPTTMIMGMGQAYFAARSIDRYLSKGNVSFDSRWRMSELIRSAHLMKADERVDPKLPKPRVALRELAADSRSSSFDEVEQTMTQEEAWVEASRCLRCYRIYSVVTAKHIPGGE
ncbi:MAG: FAD-dependent oxidoreductase [Desulfovibrionaceae bacterium]|nr:FAD-dependent oxidoreductase [Desulfovibrionaceae bacterium]